jgi:hypothetical protein
LVGPKVNGAKYMEIALGDIERNEGSPAHAHPDLEQAVYILEGEAIAGIDGVDHHVKTGRHDVLSGAGVSFDQGTDGADQAAGDLLAAVWRGSGESDSRAGFALKRWEDNTVRTQVGIIGAGPAGLFWRICCIVPGSSRSSSRHGAARMSKARCGRACWSIGWLS